MTIRQQVLAVSVLLTACALDQGSPDPNAGQPSKPDVDHLQVSTSNAMHFSECTLETPDCLSGTALVGYWRCPLNKGYEIAVGEDGRMELLNHNGDHGIGCLTCDGSFELVSDGDNLGPAWVNVGGKLAANSDEANVSWRECGALDIESCRKNPGAARSQVCKRSN